MLAGVAGLQKPLIQNKFQKKFGESNGQGRRGDGRNEDSQSRERDNTGDGKDEASQGSKDGSSQKSTSTPGKKNKFQRGKKRQVMQPSALYVQASLFR